MISQRAHSWLSDTPLLVKAHFQAKSEPFEPKQQPNGYLLLGTAENYWMAQWMRIWMNELLCEPELLNDAHLHYDFLFGSLDFRTSTAAYLSSLLNTQNSLNPEHIVIASGCSAVLEMLMMALCNPGDSVLIPAPYYPGFDHDLKMKAGVHPIPVDAHDLESGELRIEALEHAYQQAQKQGARIPVLLVASPNNPLGKVYSEQEIRMLLEWSEFHSIEVIFDEIYAQSVFRADSTGRRFTSAYTVATPTQRNHLHIVYGFAKDFGISGFKVGLCYTENHQLLRVLQELCYFSPVSNLTQVLLHRVLQHSTRLQNLIRKNQQQLEQTQAWFVKELNTRGLRVHEYNRGGIFVWADLRKYLKTCDFEAEQHLWNQLFTTLKIQISPGQIFHSTVPGYFRICFAQEASVLEAFLNRIDFIPN